MNSDEWLKMIEKIPQCSSVKFSVSWKTYKKLQKIAHRFHGIKIHARKFAHPTPYQMKRIRLNRKVFL
jgi:hypothetical protein